MELYTTTVNLEFSNYSEGRQSREKLAMPDLKFFRGYLNNLLEVFNNRDAYQLYREIVKQYQKNQAFILTQSQRMKKEKTVKAPQFFDSWIHEPDAGDFKIHESHSDMSAQS